MLKKLYTITQTIIIGTLAWLATDYYLSDWFPYFAPAIYWSILAATIGQVLYLVFRDTRFDLTGLNLLEYLALAHLLVFGVWCLNIAARVINVIPLLAGSNLWVGYIASGPWMFAFFWAIALFLFLIALDSYWSENARLAKNQYN